jgi:hypothetical protein
LYKINTKKIKEGGRRGRSIARGGEEGKEGR